MIIHEMNPIHSMDAMFGVPQHFQEILNEILYFQNADAEENEVQVMLIDSK